MKPANQDLDFKDAEMFGKIKTAPSIPTQPVPKVEEDVVVETPSDFQEAVARAQFAVTEGDGKDYVVVNERLFRYIMKNQPGNYLTYGEPGVKVYLAGKKDEVDMIEAMTAEEFATYQSKKKKNG
jgi:hypothetical protein